MAEDKKPEDAKEEQATPDSLAKPSGSESIDSGTADSPDTPPGKDTKNGGDDNDAKKPSSFKQTLKRFRLYLLIVLLLAIIGGVFLTVSSLNSKKTPPPPSVQSQNLSQSQLKQLAKSSTTSGQTLTIQGNSVLSGQALIHNNLYVAGDVQSAGDLSVPALTVTNNGSFGNAQASKLQVATTSTFQGVVTLQDGLNLKGNTSISTATVGTLDLTTIILNGSSQIQAPSHVAFLAVQNGQQGAFPLRTVDFGVLGNGGSASINGSDTSGTISINTGNNPAIGCFITVRFLLPFAGTPNILLGPIGKGAGASEHSIQPTIDPTSGGITGFKICSANVPLPNQAFAFSYFVTD